MILAVLLMLAVLKPLTALDFSAYSAGLADTETEVSDLTALADAAKEQAVAESIRAALNRSLEQQDVSCKILSVILHISEDGSIIINEVRAEGNLLTGTVFLREWLGDAVTITEGGVPDA